MRRMCDLLPDRDALPEALLVELGAMGFEVVEVEPDDPYLEAVLARKHHEHHLETYRAQKTMWAEEKRFAGEEAVQLAEFNREKLVVQLEHRL